MSTRDWERLVPDPMFRGILIKSYEFMKKSLLDNGIVSEKVLSDRVTSTSKTRVELQEIFNGGVIQWIKTLKLSDESKNEYIRGLESSKLTDFFFLFNFTQWNVLFPIESKRNILTGFVEKLKQQFIQASVFTIDDLISSPITKSKEELVKIYENGTIAWINLFHMTERSKLDLNNIIYSEGFDDFLFILNNTDWDIIPSVNIRSIILQHLEKLKSAFISHDIIDPDDVVF
ncbi:hypothetical protein DLAC_11637 [Tieghemostelium lacteum]|uniref:Uncharacterized protein n=1 Tax=Tieghemostelium lacteum TaxID=361077 RepID=A0A151ZGL3_TIELA|nr:hypothetical protein DLAC_11637 [Tieghemostelium lacteum]|eukprot:KYQ93118.1 hypothetical protein DLAC_11637 [Tieghemostelium lacteum]